MTSFIARWASALTALDDRLSHTEPHPEIYRRRSSSCTSSNEHWSTQQKHVSAPCGLFACWQRFHLHFRVQHVTANTPIQPQQDKSGRSLTPWTPASLFPQRSSAQALVCTNNQRACCDCRQREASRSDVHSPSPHRRPCILRLPVSLARHG
ncbi:hypothetical protein P154DRAFT_356001 [Amniculicola lignicola CBS 123094]|uniref:Uncharacterized protein n=1 Tax=Amniculicola lignicola CBS 123094 TaxID=1392246 RepID=A0A6A5WWX8_9PLEO|nr:hypothetical protein P154DRAFT_356001 [Amniculicola lignicola CBS 123094]